MIAYITTLSKVISDFSERIKQTTELDVGYGRLRQQVRDGAIKRCILVGMRPSYG